MRQIGQPSNTPAADADDPFVSLVKADLHLHLVGSASPGTLAALAAGHPEAGVPADADALRRFYAFRDFAHFLEVYTLVSSLVRSPADVTSLVAGLAADMAAQGTPYAEVTVTPVTHLKAGIGFAELAAALDLAAAAARRDLGVALSFVYDISAGDGRQGAELTLEAALSHPPSTLVGFGLAGPEAGVRRADFVEAFAAARAAGLHSVPHAGESVGPDEIWVALDELGAERIGHGIAAAGDRALLERLARDGVTLEVCPSSNVATGAVSSLAAHPLPRLLEAGVAVALGSDDPPMFATSLPEEYRRAHEQLGIGLPELARVARRSIEASFAPEPLASELLGRHDAAACAGPLAPPGARAAGVGGGAR